MTEATGDPTRAQLSDSEKHHIRLVEEYRYEFRRQLEQKRDSYLKEKLLAPAFIVFVTALVSGLVVPYILRVDDDQRRSVELKSRLIADLVAESVTAQEAMNRYNEQLCDYWNAAIGISHRRQNARRTAPQKDVSERQAEQAAINEDLRREHNLRVDVDRQYADSKSKRTVAMNSLQSTIRLYYGDSDTLTTYISAMAKEGDAADTLLNETHQDRLAEIHRRAKKALLTCASDDACQVVVDAANTEVEKIRHVSPNFKSSQSATQELAAYIMSHQPAMRSSAKTRRS